MKWQCCFSNDTMKTIIIAPYPFRDIKAAESKLKSTTKFFGTCTTFIGELLKRNPALKLIAYFFPSTRPYSTISSKNFFFYPSSNTSCGQHGGRWFVVKQRHFHPLIQRKKKALGDCGPKLGTRYRNWEPSTPRYGHDPVPLGPVVRTAAQIFLLAGKLNRSLSGE